MIIMMTLACGRRLLISSWRGAARYRSVIIRRNGNSDAADIISGVASPGAEAARLSPFLSSAPGLSTILTAAPDIYLYRAIRTTPGLKHRRDEMRAETAAVAANALRHARL